MDTSSTSPAANVTFSGEETMTRRSGKQSPTIHKVLWLIFLIQVCLTFGDEETVKSLCKSMTQSLSNIPKRKKIMLYLKFSKHFDTLYRSPEIENLLFPTK